MSIKWTVSIADTIPKRQRVILDSQNKSTRANEIHTRWWEQRVFSHLRASINAIDGVPKFDLGSFLLLRCDWRETNWWRVILRWLTTGKIRDELSKHREMVMVVTSYNVKRSVVVKLQSRLEIENENLRKPIESGQIFIWLFSEFDVLVNVDSTHSLDSSDANPKVVDFISHNLFETEARLTEEHNFIWVSSFFFFSRKRSTFDMGLSDTFGLEGRRKKSIFFG